MKTRYSPILQVKKDIVNKIERQIIFLNAAIATKTREIAELKISMDSITPPDSQIYAEFLAFREILSHARESIAHEQNALSMLQASKIDKLKEHKNALIEYEKINYLHVEENKRLLKNIARREQKILDDFAALAHKVDS